MDSAERRSSSKIASRTLVGLAGLVCSLALLSGSASASAAAPEATAGDGSEMSLEFTRSTARVLGSGALVFVKCSGAGSGLCTGTVALRLGGSSHKVPFSVVGGASQSLVVPLGSDKKAFDRASGKTALAVASTAQPLGDYVETTGVLHLR
ncbi:MAG: hypothetical protein ACOYD4_04475 [Solirubrobacterales bacterium]